MVEVNFLVSGEAAFLLENKLLQQVHQLVESGELLCSRFAILEIAHETDAYSSVVDGSFTYVSSADLVCPSRSYFNFPVPGISAATDDKVIGETVAHSLNVAMVVIIDSRVPRFHCAVVSHDPFPALGVDLDAASGFGHLLGVFQFGQFRRYGKRLAYDDQVARQTVGILNCLDRGFEPEREMAECVSLFDDVLSFHQAGCLSYAGKPQA